MTSRRSWRSLLKSPPIRSESAYLAGWIMLATVTVIAARVAPRLRPKPLVAATRDAYIAGQLIAAGLLVYAAIALWRRFGPKSPAAGYLAVFCASLMVSASPLAEDLAVLAGKLPLPYSAAHALLIASGAAVVPTAAIAGRLIGRSLLRLLGAFGAVAVAWINHFILPEDYSGMHLIAAMSAATLFGASIAGSLSPGAGRRRGVYARALLAVVGAFAVLVPPHNSVAIAIQKAPGDVVATWLIRLRDFDDDDADSSGVSMSDARREWWKSRLGLPPTPPSTPALLPKNAIVFFILVDCMRADLLEGEEYAADLPAIFALRRAGVQFTNARSVAPATTQSVTAIFTGRYYAQLYWTPLPGESVESVYPHKDETPRFTDLLAERGVDTVTMSGMAGITNEVGIVRGFNEQRIIKPTGGTAHAKDIMRPALERLAAQRDRPLFFYVHFTDAHAPYDHAGMSGTPRERYLRGIKLADIELAKLQKLVAQDPNLRDRTAIILSADHGEAFGEHGSLYHATTLYDELLRVPLVARLPGGAPRVVDKPVSLIDLASTFLDLYGVPAPGELMGQSLVPFFRGADPELTRPIAAESSRSMRALYFSDGFKIIRNRRRGTVEPHDLADPLELSDLFEDSGPDGMARLAALRSFFEAHALVRRGYKLPYGR